MAPELLQAGKPYSSKVDVYAFGVMLNEMLARSPPWSGMAAGDIRRQVNLPAGVTVGPQLAALNLLGSILGFPAVALWRAKGRLLRKHVLCEYRTVCADACSIAMARQLIRR
jgi:serine/threonine protein kinase